jgi:hypothetical protein
MSIGHTTLIKFNLNTIRLVLAAMDPRIQQQTSLYQAMYCTILGITLSTRKCLGCGIAADNTFSKTREVWHGIPH